MPDPLATAIIGAIGGVAGGLVTAVVGPFIQDWIAKGREQRDEDRGVRGRRIQQVAHFGELLAQITPDGPHLSTEEYAHRSLRTAAAAIGDSDLIAHVGRMHSQTWGSPAWQDALGDAQFRAGELQRVDVKGRV